MMRFFNKNRANFILMLNVLVLLVMSKVLVAGDFESPPKRSLGKRAFATKAELIPHELSAPDIQWLKETTRATEDLPLYSRVRYYDLIDGGQKPTLDYRVLSDPRIIRMNTRLRETESGAWEPNYTRIKHVDLSQEALKRLKPPVLPAEYVNRPPTQPSTMTTWSSFKNWAYGK